MHKTNLRIERQSVYADAETRRLKVGSAGRVKPAGDVFAALGKSGARKLRKKLFAAGYKSIAAQPRTK